MITIAYEPLVKKYYSSILSKGFCLSNLCYALVLLLPILILININYSWPQFERIIIKPQLQYRGYQMSCLNNDDTLISNSNLNEEIGIKNYNNDLMVAMNSDIVQIEGRVFSSQVQSCNIQMHFLGRIQTSIQQVVVIPLSFYVKQTGYYLSSAKIRGVIQMLSRSPLPQSSILSLNKTQISQQYGSSMIDSWRQSAANNITVMLQRTYESIQYLPISGGSAGAIFTFNVKLKIQEQIYFKQTSLIQKFRGIGPIFLFLAVFLYKVVIDPLVDWMIDNKIYSGRTLHTKIKSQ